MNELSGGVRLKGENLKRQIKQVGGLIGCMCECVWDGSCLKER